MSSIQPIPMKFRVPEIAFPRGWYCVADAHEISADTLKPVSYLNQQLIVYRTKSGAAQVADAYCPHLGAHLASHDGCIKDGAITCPFHKWKWDGAEGHCVDVPYAGIPQSNSLSLTLHLTREVDGMVLMWYHPQGEMPDFEPYVSTALQQDKWVLFDTRQWVSTSPFRDIFENLFDTAHIVQLHGAANMPVMRNMDRKPHGLFVDYQIDPDAEQFSIKNLEVNFTGVTTINQLFEGQGWATNFVISTTPIDNESFLQTIRLYVKDLGSKEINEMVGKPWIERFTFEVEQDFKVLNYKKHLTHPRLCSGDGPIYQYREYAKQYYA
ncbi:3-ketosteroid 9alpha-monooxygenase subunit A [Collimonas sp. OK307]|uniref:Rieske 2Fe-2S domain-containing protein n=1 Tax=Collimonas sp. OK307 TaxID=1801620 RepID=UPI0008EB00C9|nr:Rieske 2Fe-2S domain-containing protein [Collimonas sp. OK307]SFH62577.1 3-ketosteroid 9alpha-monooxygenase subunit A [Collimonas sp. OK307]